MAFNSDAAYYTIQWWIKQKQHLVKCKALNIPNLKPPPSFFNDVYPLSEVYFRIIPQFNASPRSPKGSSKKFSLSIGDDIQDTASSAVSGADDQRYLTRMMRQLERSPSMDSITKLDVSQIDKPPQIPV
jgi:hypothetical protein